MGASALQQILTINCSISNRMELMSNQLVTVQDPCVSVQGCSWVTDLLLLLPTSEILQLPSASKLLFVQMSPKTQKPLLSQVSASQQVGRRFSGSGCGPTASPDCWMIHQLLLFVVVVNAEVARIVHVIVGENLLLHSATFSHLGEKVKEEQYFLNIIVIKLFYMSQSIVCHTMCDWWSHWF